MMEGNRLHIHIGVAVILAAISATLARAQTDESLVAQPWQKGQTFESSSDVRLIQGAWSSTGEGNVGMAEVESTGRYRFTTDHPIGPAVGYQYNLVWPHGDRFPVNRALTDVSFAAGSPLGQIGQHSFWGALVGAGYAGEDTFANGNGTYAKASLITGGQLDQNSGWLLFIHYDGNGLIYPDVPDPGFVFNSKLGDNFEYVLGSGIVGATWKPLPGLRLDAYYQYPMPLNVNVQYALDQQWTLFGAYTIRQLAFHSEALPGNQRLIYAEERAEGGLRWQVAKAVHLSLAGGYAFGRQFRRGFDYRNEVPIAGLSDEPYIRFGVTLLF